MKSSDMILDLNIQEIKDNLERIPNSIKHLKTLDQELEI